MQWPQRPNTVDFDADAECSSKAEKSAGCLRTGDDQIPIEDAAAMPTEADMARMAQTGAPAARRE